MRTIGKKWPKKAPRGDYQAACDFCGAHWRRSQLKTDTGGMLYCPDEGDGLDSAGLSEMNASMAERVVRSPRWTGGGYDQGNAVASNRTTAEDIE